MPLNASWVHGTALAVESPEKLARVGYFGWGAEMDLPPSTESWFHIPLPTPVIVGDSRTKLQKVFLLCWTNRGIIREVHLWDGPSKFQEFSGLDLEGEHRSQLDSQNTFSLRRPHSVAWGVGISFLFAAGRKFEGGAGGRLILAAAGGDFLS
jgi:hypothetical protein